MELVLLLMIIIKFAWKVQKPMALSGKVALITGSAGGIGQAIAKKFADNGACVIVNDNNKVRLESANEKFCELYGNDVFTAELLDVTDPATIHKTYMVAVLKFGGVDI